MTQIKVRFVGEQRGVLSLLELETCGMALFELLATTLFALRVQIVRAESRLGDAGGRLERLWLVEFDGAPIGPARRLTIQVEVLRAVEHARVCATSVQPSQPHGTNSKFTISRPNVVES